ncbi:bifunctional diguanylate cyclase/phosphodiesterase [Thalassotalea sp. G2M2-11]|uniref:putative bifunctional diguanylate cyclase/phosphodiesterase n=1 Tax=Thalassotalea sp. G2M2-11 TaxID=2787627 RepID=UPI001F495D3E|nr:bifunctional diguanylate cyclase/phosphodiesterase [Thalassotalea sp. G2M2-11]
MKTKTKHKQIENIAHCDKLTKLIDRQEFLEHIKQRLIISAKNEYQSGLLFIDLDDFKQINNSFGLSFGDELLKQVSECLRSVVCTEKLSFKMSPQTFELNLARLGGDKFAIFIHKLKSSEDTIRIAQNIIFELKKGFLIANKSINISASIGIAIYPKNSSTTPNALLQMADVAMYHAKANGRGLCYVYSSTMSKKMRRHHYLVEEMRLALASNSFTLSYQPIVNVNSLEINYFEALIRWQHPIEGHISPSEFIPIAEDSNLILELGDWILDEACRQMASWYNAGMKETRISVNVSGIQLKHRCLHPWVIAAINKFDLPAKSLMIEITESCFVDASPELILQLEKLRNEGVKIAIDDFGTGFSSLSLLATLPVDVLKIDQLFIAQAIQNNKYNKILRSIVNMASQLDFKIVVEGIEQVEQYELIKLLGVSYIQGYFIDPPLQSHYVEKKLLQRYTELHT